MFEKISYLKQSFASAIFGAAVLTAGLYQGGHRERNIGNHLEAGYTQCETSAILVQKNAGSLNVCAFTQATELAEFSRKSNLAFGALGLLAGCGLFLMDGQKPHKKNKDVRPS